MVRFFSAQILPACRFELQADIGADGNLKTAAALMDALYRVVRGKYRSKGGKWYIRQQQYIQKNTLSQFLNAE